ncbi:multicopper oxidase [Aureococcus anophagefferens]|nr:multicopper oxidase [Aureococcus anophagefferens]
MPGERNYYSASHGLVLVAGLVLGAVLGPAARLAAGSAATPRRAARRAGRRRPVGRRLRARRRGHRRGVAGTQRVFSVFNRGLQGPTRRVALGDVVEVGTPYNGGASMVTQAPVAPGGSMAYRFVAEPAGTHWYHGHAGTDYGDGLRGLFVVEDPGDPHAAYPDGVAVMVATRARDADDVRCVLKFNYNPLNKEVGYDAQAKPSVGTLLNGLADFRGRASGRRAATAERDAHYGTNVVDVPLGAVVDIVVVNNGLGSAPVQHPLHLHGYRFWVVDHGPLPYPENDAAAPRYNLDDPPYVDTFPVDTGFYAVLRFVADNPGMWHFHCHYLIHMVNGLSLVLNVGEDAQPSRPGVVGRPDLRRLRVRSRRGRRRLAGI